jgi:hypothetical protein
MSANQICCTSTDDLSKGGGVPASVGVERGPISSNAWDLGVEWIRIGADKDKWRTKGEG